MPFESMDERSELLRPVSGYQGLYSVASDGRIWAHSKRKGRGMHPGRWLRPGVTSAGYMSVVLIHKNKTKSMTVHRIVAIAWIGPAADGAEVNHLNGDKTDNRAANLEWCTRSQNMRHSFSTGLHKRRSAKRLLTFEQACEIRTRNAEGEKQSALAAAYGISKCIASEIIRNKSYINP